MLLHILSYLGGLTAFLFVTLSLASGLLWIAELIEEHSRFAKTVGIRAIYAIIVLHALLYISDALPFRLIAFSILCHLVYLQHFTTSSWPFISLTSPVFLLSCVLVVADHFLWFFHFADIAQEAKKHRAARYRYSPNAALLREAPTFMDVAAFFAICVWFIPLFLFLSLSANDNVIPSFDTSAPPSPGGHTVDLGSAGHFGGQHKSSAASNSLVKSVLAPIVSLIPRLGRRGREADGLIAPRTPVRGSPLPMSGQQGYFPWGAEDGSQSSTPPLMYAQQTLAAEVSSRGPISGRLTPPPNRRIPSEPPKSRSRRVSQSSTNSEDVSSPIHAAIPSHPTAPPALAAIGRQASRNRTLPMDTSRSKAD